MRRNIYLFILTALVASLLTLAGTSVLTSSAATAQADEMSRVPVCREEIGVTPDALGRCLVDRLDVDGLSVCPENFSPTSNQNKCERIVDPLYRCIVGRSSSSFEIKDGRCILTSYYSPTYEASCNIGGGLVIRNGELECLYPGETITLREDTSSCEVTNYGGYAYQYPTGDVCRVVYYGGHYDTPRCEAGWRFIAGSCYKDVTTTTYGEPIQTPTCEYGELEGSMCKEVSDWAAVEYCPSGATELSSGNCVQTRDYIYERPDCLRGYEEIGSLPNNGIVCGLYEGSILQPCPSGYEVSTTDSALCIGLCPLTYTPGPTDIYCVSPAGCQPGTINCQIKVAYYPTPQNADINLATINNIKINEAKYYQKPECPTTAKLPYKDVASEEITYPGLSVLLTYQLPVSEDIGGISNSYWDDRPNRFHRALDIARRNDADRDTIVGAPVYPVLAGIVVRTAINDGTAGNNITINHGKLENGKILISRYLHLESFATIDGRKIEAKDWITTGSVIGYAGDSGTTAPHLHLDIQMATIGSFGAEMFNTFDDEEPTIVLQNYEVTRLQKYAPEDCLPTNTYQMKFIRSSSGGDDPDTPTDTSPTDPPPTTTTLPPAPTTTTTTLPSPETEYVWPIDIPISSRGSFHLLRFRINERHEIKAIRNGRVIYVGNCPRNRFTSYCLIRVSHNTDESGAVLTGYYMISNSHFESRVRRHDSVTKGQIIGYVEPSNPESTNSIFTFRTLAPGGYVNPTNYLPERE